MLQLVKVHFCHWTSRCGHIVYNVYLILHVISNVKASICSWRRGPKSRPRPWPRPHGYWPRPRWDMVWWPRSKKKQIGLNKPCFHSSFKVCKLLLQMLRLINQLSVWSWADACHKVPRKVVLWSHYRRPTFINCNWDWKLTPCTVVVNTLWGTQFIWGISDWTAILGSSYQRWHDTPRPFEIDDILY